MYGVMQMTVVILTGENWKFGGLQMKYYLDIVKN